MTLYFLSNKIIFTSRSKSFSSSILNWCESTLNHDEEGVITNISMEYHFLDNFLKELKQKNIQNCTFFIYTDIIEMYRTIIKNHLIIAAGGLVFNQNNQVLLIKRNGSWDLPKGKVEPMELYPEAAKREVEEECGIEVDITSKLGITYHAYPLKSNIAIKKNIWYSMMCTNIKNAKPQLEEGITKLKWCNLAEAKTLIATSFLSLQKIWEYVPS